MVQNGTYYKYFVLFKHNLFGFISNIYKLTLRLGHGEWFGVCGKLWVGFIGVSVFEGGAKLDAEPDLRMPLTFARNSLILFLLKVDVCVI